MRQVTSPSRIPNTTSFVWLTIFFGPSVILDFDFSVATMTKGMAFLEVGGRNCSDEI